MIFLFLGILLLIAGYFYFGYNKTEGFQASGTNFCLTGTNDQKCDMSCRPSDPVRTATFDEETAYGVYESYNLLDSNLTSPPVVIPTFIKPFNTAGALTPNDHDPRLPIPWDFDNQTLLPANTLFGTVCAEASQLIFTKCQAQVLYSDINNLSYDPTSGLFQYKSTLFGRTVYNQNEAASLQFGEMFINYHIGNLMGMAFGHLAAMPGEIANERLEFYKEASFKLERQVTDYKDALSKNGGNREAARDSVKVKTSNGVYDTAWHTYLETTNPEGTPTTRVRLSNFDKIPGIDAEKRKPFKLGRDAIRKFPLLIDFSKPEEALAKLRGYGDADVAEMLKKQQKLFEGDGVTPRAAMDSFRNSRTVLNDYDKATKNTPTGETTVFKGIADFTSAGGRVKSAAAFKRNAMIAISIMNKAITGAAVNVAYGAVIAGVNAMLVALGYSGQAELAAAWGVTFNSMLGALYAFMAAVELACMTIVPSIFNSFLDYDAVCPFNPDGTRMWNLNDYFMGNPGSNQLPFFPPSGEGSTLNSNNAGFNRDAFGTVIVSLLQNLPAFGPLLMAFGPYLCFGNTVPTITKLKNNLREPPYYNDPTLSIYNAGKKPRFEGGLAGVGGAIGTDERLFNPLTFHYNKVVTSPQDAAGNPGYPIWVDFANPIILNKMAQFYYDASRKCASTTDDGMVSFQYISKFYGLISTTELTCDVQCEITEIKFDPETGLKICEVIVPIESGTLNTLHHDRRFYFYKDIGKSTINRLNHIDPANTNALQALMEDNLNIYTVTGCTNTDGTAPDCLTYDSEGNSVENPVISLGPPSGIYYPGIVNIDENDIPKDENCGAHNRFTRYNGISHPAAVTNASINNPNAVIVQSNDADNWMYAYKDEHQTYYYPSNNVNTSVSTLRAAIAATGSSSGSSSGGPSGISAASAAAAAAAIPTSNIIRTPDTLKTTKYWTIIWNQKCSYEDAQCSINSPQGRGTIIQGTIEGFIGAGFGIGQVHGLYRPTNANPHPTSQRFDLASQQVPLAGMLMQTAINTQFPGQARSIGAQWSCTYEEIGNSPGSYILNGRIITAEKGFVIDHGPFVNWAPGYTPVINYCSKQAIELYDCVNSYAVRRFVNIYHAAHNNKQIKRIINITPSLSTGATWDVNNSIAMCKYNIDVANFDPTAFTEIPNTTTNINVGLYLQQNTGDKTCTFVPRGMPNSANPPTLIPYKNYTGSTFLAETDATIYPPQVFGINTDEPIWPTTTPGPTTSLINPTATEALTATATVRNTGSSAIQAIARATGVSAANLPPTLQAVFDTIVTTPAPQFNCASTTIQQALITSFNQAHDGVPKLLKIDNAVSMSTISGKHTCIFRARFGTVPDPINIQNTLNKNNNIAIRSEVPSMPSNELAQERNLTIILDASGNYASDDFPIHFTYTPIPKRSQWFDVPPRVQVQLSSSSFVRTGCINDTVYNDCSNQALIDILVTQYNKNNTNSKILKVWRSFTPATGAIPGSPFCDYDVERLKTISVPGSSPTNPMILDRETIRFVLQTSSISPCAYDLNLAQTATLASVLNGGISLNSSSTLGMLKTPYTAALAYTTGLQSQFFTALHQYIGYDINGIINSTTTNILTQMQNIRNKLYKDTTLRGCPNKTCMDDTIITAMINRYNYDNYPSYPPTQNTVNKNTIIRVTKVGTATPIECQVELYLRTDFFEDFLYNPLPQDTHFYMHDYVFNLNTTSTPCNFTVKPFTRHDISFNTMDISGDAFTLTCPSTGICPSVITASSAASISWATTDYQETMIPCIISNSTDPVLMLITNMYNTTTVFTKLGVAYNNTIKRITKVFNAMPNILEFKIVTKRVYWDSNYSQAYYTGVDDDEDSFLIVTWPVGTAYQVETGYYWKNNSGVFIAAPTSEISIISGYAKNGTNTMCRPTIQEIFFPDLTFTTTGIFQTAPNGSQIPVILPYLANDGLTPLTNSKVETRRYQCNPTTCLNPDGSAV